MALSDVAAAWTEFSSSSEDARAELSAAREAALPEFQSVGNKFLAGELTPEQFRFRLASLTQQHTVWGFGGGAQMFLNQLVRLSDEAPLAGALRAAVLEPADDADADAKIVAFAQFVEEVRAEAAERGEAKPALGHIP